MTADFATLGYLEWRQLVNRLRAIARNPGRALLYLFTAVYVIAVLFIRTRSLGHGGFRITGPLASVAISFALFWLAVPIFSAAFGSASTFDSPADARFLIGSQLNERRVVLWLQLRHAALSIARTLFLVACFIYFVHLVALPAALAVCGWLIVQASIGIPVLQIRRFIGPAPCVALAGLFGATGALGLAALAIGFLHPAWNGPARALERMTALWMQAGMWPALALFTAALAVLAASYFGARDLYPELYLASLRETANTRGRRGLLRAGLPRYHHSGSAASWTPLGFSGALTTVWMELIGLRRAPKQLWLFAGGIAFSAVGGASLGVLSSRSHDPIGLAISIAGTLMIATLLLITVYSTVAIGMDLRKPLWWLNADSLRKRLYVRLAVSSWKLLACVLVGLAAWGITTGHLAYLPLGLALATALLLLTNAIGLALYAIFPSRIDQRGPLAFVRTLLTYVLFMPPLLTGALVAGFTQRVTASVAFAAILSVVETALLIEFSVGRIASSGAAYGQGEAA